MTTVAPDLTDALQMPRRCRLCTTATVYAPKWCCAACFHELDSELQRRVREVADLPLTDPRKADVIADCLRWWATPLHRARPDRGARKAKTG
ncbi:hypothetical protein BJY24_007839 [Nocardia transvalensis]|uniref:Uncharacterized protein n=1 Tax=Nocardia transvalensis TaxID=37333 RepID=A0A7W9PMS5_9NOCA|nr:hypothetical protein [Nocardia transvalensis]MBB5918927.1 hypothetical protein [Nocardia transvalensis]